MGNFIGEWQVVHSNMKIMRERERERERGERERTEPELLVSVHRYGLEQTNQPNIDVATGNYNTQMIRLVIIVLNFTTFWKTGTLLLMLHVFFPQILP